MPILLHYSTKVNQINLEIIWISATITIHDLHRHTFPGEILLQWRQISVVYQGQKASLFSPGRREGWLSLGVTYRGIAGGIPCLMVTMVNSLNLRTYPLGNSGGKNWMGRTLISIQQHAIDWWWTLLQMQACNIHQ